MLIWLLIAGFILFFIGSVFVVKEKKGGWIICLLSTIMIFGSMYAVYRIDREEKPIIYEDQGSIIWKFNEKQLICHYNEKNYLLCEA